MAGLVTSQLLMYHVEEDQGQTRYIERRQDNDKGHRHLRISN